MFNKLITIISVLFYSATGMAGAMISYNGRILSPDGKPLEESSVAFTISIFSPEPEKCLLYQEKQIIDMSGSGGLFAISVGSGKGVKTSDDPNIDMDLIFANNTDLVLNTVKYPKLKCALGSEYRPGLLDLRVVAVTFNDGKGSGDQTLPGNDISYVPMALNSNNAQKFNGYTSDKFVRVDTTDPVVPLTQAEYNNLKSNVALVGRMTTVENTLNDKANLSGAVFLGAITAPAYLYTSDQKFKTNVESYPQGLEAILNLRGVTFNWKNTNQSEVGLIAQEVEKVDSRLVVDVKGTNQEEYKSVKYGNIVAILIEAVKELFAKFESRNSQVDKKLELMSKEIELLRQEVQELKKAQAENHKSH